MDKFKKIDKEFLLTDSSVNSYGFRLHTAGYLMSEFEKNPIGYYMHDRANGVLVRWSDFRKEGDQVFAKPNINLAHPRGQRTVDEIENGFLNAASCGHFVVIEMDKSPKNPLPNQTGPDVTKWYNREASLVDIPGNYNALKNLFDKDGNEINLADFNLKKPTMKVITLTAEQIQKLNLSAEAPEAEVTAAFENLVSLAAKVPGLEQQLADANNAKSTAVKELQDFKKEANKKTIEDLLATAQKEGKITVAAGKTLAVDYEENPTGLKNLIDALPVYNSISEQINLTGGDAETLKNLSAKTYDELDKSGELPKLKALSIDAFKAKYKEAFGKEYTGE